MRSQQGVLKYVSSTIPSIRDTAIMEQTGPLGSSWGL